jgi:hypothetical protein
VTGTTAVINARMQYQFRRRLTQAIFNTPRAGEHEMKFNSEETQ